MNGEIKYTLGLNSAPFLAGLRGALTGLAGLSGVALSLGGVMRGVASAISEGGKLQDLSAKTGESVASLYSLRAAFEAVGANAESLPGLLLNLQRAVGGVDEAGQGTGKVFERLGISLDSFKTLSAAQQIEIITSKLAGLDKTEQTSILSKIFGRGFGDMKLVVGQVDEFKQKLLDTAAAGQFVARSASGFNKLGNAFKELKTSFGLIFTGIAEGLAPTLQMIGASLNKINFVGIGQKLSEAIGGVIGIIKNGRIGEAIALSFEVGFESVLTNFAVYCQSMTTMLVTAFSSPAIYKGLLAGLSGAGSNALDFAGQVGSFATAGVRYLAETTRDSSGKYTGKSYEAFLAEEQGKVDANTGERRGAINEFAVGIGTALKALSADLSAQAKTMMQTFAVKTNSEASRALEKLWSEVIPSVMLAAAVPKGAADTGGGGINQTHLKGAQDVDALTRIGFFSGNQSSAVEHARQTSKNTADMLAMQQRWYEAWRRKQTSASQKLDYSHV